MTRQLGMVSGPAGTVTVLSVSPLAEDHLFLQAIVGHSTWRLFASSGIASALALLRQHEVSVVLCERQLMPGTWIDILDHLRNLSHPPTLIVTSRLADERLWAEALNLGAWDVLAKPFDLTQVIRSVKSAWQHWHDQIHLSSMAPKVMKAAS